MKTLAQIMAATSMTREQIRRAVATGYGSFNPDTYAYVRSEADQRLANLFTYMRESRRMAIDEPITTQEQANELRLLIQKHAPVDTGALRDSFDDPRTVQIMPDGSVEVDSPLPYARIQDLGGTIHRTGPNGSYTITIPAQHYVGAAIAEFNAEHATQPLTQQPEIFPTLAGMLSRGIAAVNALRLAGGAH